MKRKKITQREMIDLLGQTVLTYSFLYDRKMPVKENLPPASIIIGFMSGRDDLWTDACRKFIDSHKDALKKYDEEAMNVSN